jgi:hypothetical protein
MIKTFVDRFMAQTPALKAGLREKEPQSYGDLVKRLVETLADEDDYSSPDPSRITCIDHGEYQGTQLYVIGAGGYQPSTYWAFTVGYGSCSGCDTFQRIHEHGEYNEDYTTRKITDGMVDDYWTLMLHMVQRMKQIAGFDLEAEDSPREPEPVEAPSVLATLLTDL